MNSKLKLRLAQGVSIVLGVMILAVVALMIYLSINKFRQDQRPESKQTPKDAFSVLAPTQGLVPDNCEISNYIPTQSRLTVVIEGGDPKCARLIVVNTNKAEIVGLIQLR